jgi:PAS domain S-box-containing protein
MNFSKKRGCITELMEQGERFEASRSSEGRYRMLVEAITDYAIYMLDPKGIVSSWNPGAKRFKGYEENEIIGQHFSRFYTSEDQATDLPKRALETALREGKFESEGWRVRKDGSRFWAFVIIDPIRDDRGKLVGFAKVTRDLTERRRAEAELFRSQEQFRLLVQGVTDYAIYLLNPEGQVSSWNAGAQRIKGYSPDEAIGTHFSRFYTADDQKAGLPQVALDTAKREGRFEREGIRVRKDGSKFWAHVIIDPIRNPDGSLLGFAKITRDITERKNAECQLEKTREALVHAQKMEAIGQLTGGVAHDFNNLLMAIQSSLELLKKRLPQDDQHINQLLANAIQGTQRGAGLTQRMLAFARRQELKLVAVDVPELVREMKDLLQSSLGPTIEIETSFPLSLPKALADPNHLGLAVLNLAVNARDAMPKGGSLTIGAKERMVTDQPGLKPGRYVCLAVTDQGVGMDEETLQRAVEPFFTTKGVGKGTGLGLPMVHGMVEQTGGKLLLRSQLGEGTTAELFLPLAMDDKNVFQKSTRPPPKVASTKKLIIVSVDDDPLIAMNTTAMLEDLGHVVHSAPNAKRALEILRKTDQVDLLITDQAMPGISGVELAATARAERPGLAVIIATGYAELPTDAAQELPRLSKPFFEADLAKAIAQVIQ